MTRVKALFAACIFSAISPCVLAQQALQATPDQRSLLASSDPVLAANKRLVYDFWREVFEGGHVELADKYLAESYIQHNPNVPSGRTGFVQFLSQFSKPHQVADSIQTPLVSIVAERDMVILVFVKHVDNPDDAAKSYTTTWFDAFRVANGKIAEHWDAALKQ